MDYRTDNIIELSWLLNDLEENKRISIPSIEEVKAAIVEIAENFEIIHDDSDWCELDYLEEIQKYGEEQFMIRFGIE